MSILTVRQSNNRWRFTGVAGGILAATVGAALALLMSSCSGTVPSPEVEAKPASSELIELSPEAQQNAKLKIANVEERPLERTLVATGIVAPDQNRLAHIRPLAQGVAEEVVGRLGNRVQAGQPLLTYDNIELGELIGQYRSLQAEIEREQAQADLAKSYLARAESLLAAEAIAQKEFELRKAEHAQAVATVKSKEAELARVEEKIHRYGLSDEDLQNLNTSEHGTHRTASHTILRAPFAAVITMQDVAVGEMIEPARDVYTLVDTSEVWVLAGIYEKDLGLLGVGQNCRLKVPAYPDQTFTGKITYISDVLDSESRTSKLRCVVANPDGRLKLEMFATVEIPLPLQRNAIVVPETAVQLIGQQSVVFVPQDDTHFQPRPVELGERSGEWVEVRSGLRTGEKVVTDGAFYVKSALLKEQISGGE
ncbi:MAG: efflux RND transporter periplasmic adaptor subunit [Acidobacteria bacterium]|nr:efflux RND transporter periplasmic adaptor subunit [Acidobacteriota bacterium]